MCGHTSFVEAAVKRPTTGADCDSNGTRCGGEHMALTRTTVRPRRARIARRSVALLAAVAAVGIAAPAAAWTRDRSTPSMLAFYDPPQRLRAAVPGTVIRSEPFPAVRGARAWKILYHSRALDGRDIVVSGVVVAPTGRVPAGGRPVVAWAHGTHGIADRCAPSRIRTWVRYMPGIREMVDNGYVVAATDYEGLGTPGVHPYLMGDSEGRGVLDAVRAAQNMKDTHANNTTFVFGHSQGGQAALFAGEIAPTYAPELDLRGVAAVAPAAEISAMMPAAASIPETLGFVVMGLTGAHAISPDADPAHVLTPRGLDEAKIIRTHCYEAILKAFRQPVADVIAHNPADVPAFADVMARATAGNRPTAAPLFVLQGLGDDIVYKTFTDMYVQHACAIGDTVRYQTYGGAGHYDEAERAAPDVVNWIKDRLAGRAAASTC